MNFNDKDRERKMVFYGRVSTEQEAQLSALKNQMQWYDDQLNYHKNWICVDKYIDEGITGTQAKKRPSFLRMIEDAKKGKFDLIVTREVSRFARNTVETLVFTRDLKNKYGIEVYFIEDNIWTMDGDGELRLTIMATLAQEESRKTSERVKAGQKISRDNGVLYGSGNILGYERVGDTYVINEEQAETVRMIFELYLQGLSAAKIRDELCIRGRKTSSGNKVWYASVIINILKNPTYKGIMRYGLTYTNNFLEQKHFKNLDTDSYEYKQGNFPAIIPSDIWDKAQEIMASKTKPSRSGKNVGSKISTDVWMRKLKCNCGSSMGKNRWRVNKDGVPSYGYQCHKQRNIGSKKFREKHGLDTEGYCNVPMVADWKLAFMAKKIIQYIWEYRKESTIAAYQMLIDCYTDESENDNEKIKQIKLEIQKNQNKIENLIDMRTDGEISKNEFVQMRKKFDDKISELKSMLETFDNEDMMYNNKKEMERTLKEVEKALNENIDFSQPQLSDEVIDKFIDKVIALGDDKFQWFINLSGMKTDDEDSIRELILGIEGRKNKHKLVDKDGKEIKSLSFDQYNREYDSRKIGFLFTTIEFTFEQAKAWKTQVYGTLYKYWWHKNIEVEIYLTI